MGGLLPGDDFQPYSLGVMSDMRISNSMWVPTQIISLTLLLYWLVYIDVQRKGCIIQFVSAFKFKHGPCPFQGGA